MAKSNEGKTGPVWRESASLIICAKSPNKVNDYDYKVLVLKRSDRTTSFKNQGVFPGGIFDPYDENVEWLKYFKEFGVTQQLLKELIVLDNKTERPKILAPRGNGCYDRFFESSKIWAREISLRINAIRETFEEVGVFLCRNREQLYLSSKEGFYISEYDIAKWQKAVHDDPKEFLNMCKEFKVVPDLWGLYEWCGWASPAIVKRGVETAFFITFLNEVPKVMCEETEVKDILWLPPNAYLKMVRGGQMFLLPPQIYELSRLIPFKSYDYIKNFAWQRSKKGITMFRSIGYTCTDGEVFTLPGDDYYTGDPYLSTILRKVDCRINELRARSKNLNRVENPRTPNVVVFSNIKPFNDHLMPVSDEPIDKNKL